MAVNGISFRGKSLNEVVAIIKGLINGDVGNEECQSTITLQFGREKKPAKRSEVSIRYFISSICMYICMYVCDVVCENRSIHAIYWLWYGLLECM